MTKLYLFDIEGTTTDIHFVHKVLFPYAKDRMKDFILDRNQDEKVARAIQQVKETVAKEEHIQLTNYEVINRLEQWIVDDRKHGALKEIQGLIWEEGYQKNDFQGHVYPDVRPFFERLKQNQKTIGIYSSGSVHAQKLIMGHSTDGDLTPFISYYFDTKVGHKREAKSYQNIAEAVSMNASDIHFFSDIPQELEAAKEAEMQVTQLIRPGTAPSEFKGIKDFSEFKE